MLRIFLSTFIFILIIACSSFTNSPPRCDAECQKQNAIEEARQILRNNDAGLSCEMPNREYWYDIASCHRINDEDRYDNTVYSLGWSEEKCDLRCFPEKCPKNSGGIYCLKKPSLGERFSDWWNSEPEPKNKSSGSTGNTGNNSSTTTCQVINNPLCKPPFCSPKVVCKTY